MITVKDLNAVPAQSEIQAYTHTSVSIGTSSIEVVAPNSLRKHLIITNRGTTVCYLNFGSTASATTGIPLNPTATAGQAGGIYEVNDSNLFKGQINAICATGGSTTIAVAEGV